MVLLKVNVVYNIQIWSTFLVGNIKNTQTRTLPVMSSSSLASHRARCILGCHDSVISPIA